MLVNLPILTLLLATTSALARPHPAARDASAPGLPGQGQSVSRQIYAKRQTTRDDIMYRRHVKDTVKLVEKAAAANDLPTRTAGGTQPERKRALYPRQSAGGFKRDLPAEERAAEEEQPAKAKRVLLPRQSAGGFKRRAAIPAGLLTTSADEEEFEDRTPLKPTEYKRCKASKKSGYAHYPGWKLLGDDLSGAVPVSPELACVTACNKYGGSCSGVFYDASAARCYLKGTHTSGWDFESVDSDDVTDLIGGCALWSSVVPPEMDAVCCLD